MIAELTASPSVFETTGYSDPDTCERQMEGIKDALLQRSVLRDLRSGGLTARILSSPSLSLRGKEILKKMRKRGRILSETRHGELEPVHEEDWVAEGIEANRRRPLDCVLTNAPTKERFLGTDVVEDVLKMTRSEWWKQTRRVSWRVQRSREDFIQHLEPLLLHANSLQFIEPFFDPSKTGDYGWFIEILPILRQRSMPAILEIHRGVKDGSGRERVFFDREQLQRSFSALSEHMKKAGIAATVYTWLEMHNRYLLTNIGSFQLGNSLIEKPTEPKDTWSCLDSDTQDDLQREYDPNASSDRFKFSFTIGATD
jgi:hypothetical protein